MSEDEKLVEAVAREACRSSGTCLYFGQRCNTSRCSVSAFAARQIIAAVRRFDAERGMVLVPVEASDEVLDAGAAVQDGDIQYVWGAMIEAAAPVQREGGE